MNILHKNLDSTYDYDDADRLTKLENKTSASDTIATYEFTLDANGNRTQTVQSEPIISEALLQSTVYTYNNKKNRLLSASGSQDVEYDYDDEGQLWSTNEGLDDAKYFYFDYEHRIRDIAGHAVYKYDGVGNRLWASRYGEQTRYIYDATGNLLAEADGSNTIIRYYIYGQGLMSAVTPAGQVYCYHFNATGSTVAMTDDSEAIVNKYAYDPFGNISSRQEAFIQPFQFVGQFGVMKENFYGDLEDWEIETPVVLYYMKARYYDPQVGRFISEDPIGFDGGDVNLYAYVGGNPVMAVDPEGTASPTGAFLVSYTITHFLGDLYYWLPVYFEADRQETFLRAQLARTSNIDEQIILEPALKKIVIQKSGVALKIGTNFMASVYGLVSPSPSHASSKECNIMQSNTEARNLMDPISNQGK